MTQKERRIYLIQELLREEPRYREMTIPAEEKGQNDLLRSLMNVHMPSPSARNFCAYRTNICRQNGTHGVLWTAPVCPPFPEIPASFYGRATSRH